MLLNFFLKRWHAFKHFFCVFGRKTTWLYAVNMLSQAKSTQSQRLEYNHVPFRGRRQGSRMFSSQWTFRLGWPLGRVLLELKAVMAVNERN